MAKNQYEVGLTPYEHQIVSQMASTEDKPFAAMLGEIVRLGIPCKAEAMGKVEVWQKVTNRSKLYQRLASLSPKDVDKLMRLLENNDEGDDKPEAD